MRRRASFRWLLLLPALVAAGCTDDEPDPVRAGGPRATLEDASARTLAAGPAAIGARVRAGRVRYRLGTRPVEVRLGSRGLIERLRFEGPGRVKVRLSLSRHGEARRVPDAIAYAFE